MLSMCQDIEKWLEPTWKLESKCYRHFIAYGQMELGCERLANLSFAKYEHFLEEIRFYMASELNTINIIIVADSDVSITD